MDKWGAIKNQQMSSFKGFDESDLFSWGVMMSQKPGLDLIQNCDLPPPMKVVYARPEVNKPVITSMDKQKGSKLQTSVDDDIDDKDGLLKALRLSQTRAREAEAKFAAIAKERDALSVVFIEDSMQIYAYRQLVRLLEVQVSKLKLQKREAMKQVCSDYQESEKFQETEAADDENGNGGGLTWIMAVALCLGIAGFGFAFGCRYYNI